MREWLTRAQFELMRVIGMRKLREAVEVRLDGVRGDVLQGLDGLRGESSDRGNAHDQRLTALECEIEGVRSALSQLATEEGNRGRANHERGMASDARLDAIERALAKLVDLLHVNNAERALGDVRVEISCLRADFAREAEMRDDVGGGRSGLDSPTVPLS